MQGKELKCPYCDWKPKKNSQGYLNGHIREKHKDKMERKEETGQREKMPGNVCPDCGEKNIRLLNRNNKSEAEALGMGFKKICIDCEEVF